MPVKNTAIATSISISENPRGWAAARLQRSDAIWLRERAAWLGRMESILQRDEDWQQALRDANVTILNSPIDVIDWAQRIS